MEDMGEQRVLVIQVGHKPELALGRMRCTGSGLESVGGSVARAVALTAAAGAANDEPAVAERGCSAFIR